MYIILNIEEENEIAILVKSLPIQYDSIVIVQKEKEPIHSLESIVHSLQEEERKHNDINEEVATNHALHVLLTKHFTPCKNYKKTNHLSSNCYKVKKCTMWGKKGHLSQLCFANTRKSNTNITSNN